MKTKTIREISLAWKRDKQRYVKQSTYAAYVLVLENHILSSFGDCDSLSEKLVQEFVLQKLNAGLSIKTVKDILIVLKMVMKFGVKNGWMNYCEWDIKYPTTVINKEMEVLTVTHHKKILDFIKQNFTFRNLGIYISLTTGLRIGEVCGLKWSDINTDSGIITVNRTIERIYVVEGERRHTELVINSPKTKNSCREIPMNKELLAMVKPLKKVVNASFYVLTNEEKPTEPRTYRNYYHRLMKHLDIPRLKYHGLRHSFATAMLSHGAQLEAIRRLLGHESVVTPSIYTHTTVAELRKQYAAAHPHDRAPKE